MTYPGFDLTQIDPRLAFQQADRIASANLPEQIATSPKFLIEVYDNVYNVVGEIGDYISATVTFQLNGVGTATIVMKGDDPLWETVMACGTTVVPITIWVNNRRWSGRVDTAEDARVDGVDTVTLQCISDYAWLQRILVWPNAYLPIEVQEPKQATYIGPACSVISFLLHDNVIRLQAGLWEFFNNILDPQAWFATAIEGRGLLTPVAIVPVDLIHDQSKWVAVTSQMASADTLIEQITKDQGISVTADLWLPGEPQPTTAFTLTQPTIVIRIRDNSGLTGPTGTMIDGLIREVVDIADGTFGEAIQPFTASEFAPPGVDLAAYFGFNWKRPWILLTDHPRGGVKEFHTMGHHTQAHTVVSGGRSPEWVNKLIDLILEFALSEILLAIGVVGIASTLLDGVFDNIILAYQEIENAPRRFQNGPYCFPEVFVSAGSTAYTLSEFFNLFNGMWDSRGYYSWELVYYDGEPYSFGYDFDLGDLTSWLRRNKLYTDYVLTVTATDDRTKRVEVTVQVGDNKSRESPWASLQRNLSGLQSAMQAALLAQN
ncbi:hypothetical protein ACFYU5_19135 [Nocardia aobensis]|uniref:Gp28/Gp37-like domain-containing protein n=1 Tax=Nocardia aobensis TaxID=257277 RepID=A0ABW6P5V6_9NOCA